MTDDLGRVRERITATEFMPGTVVQRGTMILDVLLSPVLALSVVIALIYGAVFHLWQGRTLRDLGLFVVAALAGFLVGQLLGGLTRVEWLSIGQLHVVEGTIMSWIALVIAKRLKL